MSFKSAWTTFRNLMRAFGSSWYEVWKRLVTGQLMRMGMNTLGNWSDAELFGRMRARGLAYLNANICADLIENRADYSSLVERRRQMKEDEEVVNILSSGAKRTAP